MSEAGYSDTFNLVRKPDGRYLWQNNPNLIAKPQRHNRYQGYVYILTNAGTRSCSGIFSSLMKEHTEAVFVGAATGTAQCGTGGMVMAVRLPHTGVSIYFTTAEYTCAVSNKEDSKGVMPDISVSESFGDRQQQEDTVLNKVIQVIKER